MAALGTYRRQFRRVALAALLILVPMDILVTTMTAVLRDIGEAADLVSLALASAVGAASLAGTVLGLTFFAGVLDRVVAVDQYGHPDASLLEVLRKLPFGRLVLASFLTSAVILAGLVLFVVPGVVLLVLFSVVGPLIVIEELSVVRALLRSMRLVWPHMLLAFVVVTLPTVFEDTPLSYLERFHWYERPFIRVPVDVVVTLIVGGVVGVLEVTLAHALIADQKRRLTRREADQAADRGAPG